MKTHNKVIKEYTNNTARYAFNHFNWPPENVLGLKKLLIIMNMPKNTEIILVIILIF